MQPDGNPFAVLSLIVAPAILTNASSVLVMSTGTRLARAVDRARELSKQLEADLGAPESERRLRELVAVEQRALLLLRGLRSVYVAMGGFAMATLVSLLGAVLSPIGLAFVVRGLEITGVIAGLIAVGGLVYGSVLLVRDTQIAVQVLTERAATVRAQAAAERR